jgi:hypothetical protein
VAKIMATDDDDPPAPAKSGPSGGGKAAPGGKDSSSTPPPLVAPIFPTVDRTDPLLPDQLSRHESTARQYLQAYQTIVRIARHPEREPGWPLVIEGLRQGEEEYAELVIVARARYEKQRRLRDLTSRLPMTDLANIKAADDAEGQLQDAWLVWRAVYATFFRLRQALHPGEPTPSEMIIPPDLPDSSPAPEAAG